MSEKAIGATNRIGNTHRLRIGASTKQHTGDLSYCQVIHVRKRILLIVALTLVGTWLAQSQQGDQIAQDPQFSVQDQQAIAAAHSVSRAFAAVARSVTPAVVNINTTKIVATRQPTIFRDFFGRELDGALRSREREVHSLGSGSLISADGLILTNNHVVSGATEISVRLNCDRQFSARIVGTDPATDLAVLKIDAEGLPYLRWGDSAALEVGEWVVAVGSPFGLAYTVTSGIISATGRTDIGIIGYEDLIQTDAAINPGNSGGPLVNLRGELIGVNTAIASRSGANAGVGFAVPSNMARKIASQLVHNGTVVRGWIGIIPRDLSPELARRHAPGTTAGVFVEAVYRGQPAIDADIQPGDVIAGFDGARITSVGQLSRLVAEAEVGSQVAVSLVRGRSERAVRVMIGRQPTPRDGRPIRGM